MDVLINWIYVFLFWLHESNSHPIRNRRELITDNVQHFLMKYGYLPMSDLETGNLRTEVQLRQAIRTMQRFGHVPQTGYIDQATKALMNKPRCSLPDVAFNYQQDEMNEIRTKRYIKQGQRWKKTNLTWGVRTFPERIRDVTSHPDHLSKWEIQREFRLATQVWGRKSKLNFIELVGDDATKADIVIDFSRGYHGDGYPFDGPGRTLAHAFYPGEEEISGNMHFDTEEHWVQHKDSEEIYQQISLFITAAHELGHALGLYHSDVEGALMSPYLVKFPLDFVLPEDDTRGIQELYGPNEDYRPHERPSTMAPMVPTTRGPTYRPTRPTGNTVKPNTCDTDYDAISVIRREIYIFKGKYFWRVDGQGKPRPNYPAEILLFWPMLPKNLTHIDAVYEKYNEGYIVFFIGQRYYICQGNQRLVETGPLRKYGLPEDLPKIDAAFIWGHNGLTYFFADTMYWRFDETISHVELDYPRDMAMWQGIPYYIDSAFKFNGTTYFFKGKMFWEFDDLRMKASKNSPALSSPFWFSCPNSFENPYRPPSKSSINTSSIIQLSRILILIFIFSLFY